MQKALITGAASGIGAAVADVFCANQWQTVLVDRAEFSKQQQDLNSTQCYQLDIRNQHAIREISAEHADIDALILNAGIYSHKSLLDLTVSEWQEVMDTNITANAFCAQAVLANMVLRKSGVIILLGSDQSIIAKQNSFAYTVSKAAVAQMAKSIAVDYGQYGIRAIAVCPGTVKTPMTEKIVQDWELASGNKAQQLWQQIEQENTLNRLSTTQEVAELIYFLSSNKASSITGCNYSIDAGFTAL